jgi:sigma-E factor negative regulatory protein RseC
MSTLHQPDDGLIEGLARVVAVDRDQVWLVAEQPAACGSCATRGACGGGRAKPSANWRVSRQLDAHQAPLVLGDTVRVGVDRSALTRATLAAFALPLVTMLIAASSLQEAGDTIAIAAALAGLVLGAAAAKVVVQRWRDALVPVVLGRALAAAGSSCATTAGKASLRAIDIPVIHQRSL